MKRKYLASIIIFLLVSLMLGCSNKYTPEDGFTYSTLQDDFPIPRNSKVKTSSSDHVEYKLIDIGKEATHDRVPHPDVYLKKIKED